MIKKNFLSGLKIFGFLLLLTPTLRSIASAQSVSDCLACHEDKTLSTERNGKTVSLFVDRAVQKKIPAL